MAWIVGLFLTLWLVGLIRKRAALDVPNDRSLHSVPTPRGGGLGIVLAFVVGGIWSMLGGPSFSKLVCPMLLGGIPIAAIGWVDDRGHVSPKLRALVHLVSCFLAFAGFAYLGHDASIFSDPTTWIWLAAVTVGASYFLNLFNFMDGLDGLAGSEAAFVGIVAAGLLQDQALVTMRPDIFDDPAYQASAIIFGIRTVAGIIGFSCVGFLVWNWPPARVFMGDVGSGFLGFVLAFLALCLTIDDVSAMWPWLILLGVFIVDGSYTLLIRLFTGQKWYEAHNLHAFQKAAKKLGHLKVTLSVITINLIWLLPIAAYARQNPGFGGAALAVAYVPLVLLAYRYRAGIPELQPSVAK